MTDTMIEPWQPAGAGLVIGARAQAAAFPVGPETRFVDACDLPTLRRRHPAWRSLPLAPVDLVDETGLLAGVADDEVDFVIDWTLEDGAGAGDRMAPLARVLRPGGLLAWPARDSRFVAAGDDAAHAGWPFARFAGIVAAVADDHAPQFEFDRVQRHGCYNLALFRRRAASIAGGAVLVCDDQCLALDGPFLRLITSIDTLRALQAAGVPTIPIGAAERALYVAGPLFNPGDVTGYLAKRDAIP